MANKSDEYSDFVEHPRFGRRPQITRLNPATENGTTYFHWHSPKSCRIPGTAVPADISQQMPCPVPVTHYFDVKRSCRDCGRPFIFFAREQKHWYETLGFKLDSDCVRCVPCRKQQQGLANCRERYEELFHVKQRTMAENLEMAECCLTLIEDGLFHQQQTQHVRMLLNLTANATDGATQPKRQELLSRVVAIESGKSESSE